MSPPHLAWAQFMATYQESWGRKHPLLGLLMHPGSAKVRNTGNSSTWLGCARGGGMVAALRHTALVERLCHHDGIGDSGEAEVAGLPSELLGVHRCMKEAAALLGPLCLDSFVQMIVSGARGSIDCKLRQYAF